MRSTVIPLNNLYVRIVAAITIVCALGLGSVALYSSHFTAIQLEHRQEGPAPADFLTRELQRTPRARWSAAVAQYATRFGVDVVLTDAQLGPLTSSWGPIAAGDVTRVGPDTVRIRRTGFASAAELYLRGGAPVVNRGRVVARAFTFPRSNAGRPDVAGAVARTLWASVLVATLAALAVAILLGTYITRPLRELCAAAEAMARGKLSTRVRVDGTDDIGALATSFNAMADSVERTEGLRRRMVTDVAHELRSPLTRLQALVEMSLDGHARAEDITPALHREIINLGLLVDDLRDLTLADVHALSIDASELCVGDCIQDAIAGARVQSRSANVTIVPDIAPDLPTVVGDRKRLRQVFHNLLDNALRYADPGGTVVFGATAAGSYVECYVQDDGPGIAAHDLDNIFERFYRADESRARSTGGSGLGLAIVKEIVAAHGGAVDVESAPGMGARFTVRLPAANRSFDDGTL